MRILFIGDSLGLPRPHRINNYSPLEKELAVAYEDTYSSILNAELLRTYNFDPYVEIINRSKRFYTIKDINNEFADHLFFFEPDTIVMQVGIVDCWFRDHLNGKQMVNKEDYEKYLINILNLLKHRPHCRLIIVGIAPTSNKMEKKYKGLNKEISLYNDVLKSYVDHKAIFYVDLENRITPSSPEKYLLPDDQHLNKQGNKLLADLLTKILTGFIESDRGVQYYEMDSYQQSFDHFQKSYEKYPYYLDNLYNMLVLAYQLEERDKIDEIVTFIKEKKIISDEINEIINVLIDDSIVL